MVGGEVNAKPYIRKKLLLKLVMAIGNVELIH